MKRGVKAAVAALSWTKPQLLQPWDRNGVGLPTISERYAILWPLRVSAGSNKPRFNKQWTMLDQPDNLSRHVPTAYDVEYINDSGAGRTITSVDALVAQGVPRNIAQGAVKPASMPMIFEGAGGDVQPRAHRGPLAVEGDREGADHDPTTSQPA